MQVHSVERQFASETQGHHHHARHPEEQDIMAFKNWWPKGPKNMVKQKGLHLLP